MPPYLLLDHAGHVKVVGKPEPGTLGKRESKYLRGDRALEVAGRAAPDVSVGYLATVGWVWPSGRVAYVDVDAHHGDGVEQIFWDDPRVLTISLHETGQMLFPGTGFPGDAGGPEAKGSAVNVALPPGTGDAGWLRAFHAIVPPLVREFAPDILVTQQGCDSHREDPLAHLSLTIDGQRASYLALGLTALHGLAFQVIETRPAALVLLLVATTLAVLALHLAARRAVHRRRAVPERA